MVVHYLCIDAQHTFFKVGLLFIFGFAGSSLLCEFFSSVASRGYSPVVGRRHLIMVASRGRA